MENEKNNKLGKSFCLQCPEKLPKDELFSIMSAG